MKRQRKLLHKAFSVNAIPAYHPLIASETESFLRRILTTPGSYQDHTRRYAGGLALSVVYGYEAAPVGDDLLCLAEECVNILANEIASGGGIWPVDIIPALKYLPTWAPGSGFQLKAARWKARMEEFVEKPYDFLKTSLVRFLPSFVPRC